MGDVLLSHEPRIVVQRDCDCADSFPYAKHEWVPVEGLDGIRVPKAMSVHCGVCWKPYKVISQGDAATIPATIDEKRGFR